MARPKKIEDLLETVRNCIKLRRFRVSGHAQERMSTRNVPLPEVLHVLKTGWSEKREDKFSEEFNTWKYSIRSQTKDEKDVRVIVAFDAETKVVVITVIDLNLDD